VIAKAGENLARHRLLNELRYARDAWTNPEDLLCGTQLFFDPVSGVETSSQGLWRNGADRRERSISSS